MITDKCEVEVEVVLLCGECNGPVGGVSAGDEGWDVCEDCGTIEGNNFWAITEAWEQDLIIKVGV